MVQPFLRLLIICVQGLRCTQWSIKIPTNDHTYVCCGKSPKSEMMKLMHRNGWQFSCGWEPPAISLDIFGVPIATVAPAELYWLRSVFEAIALTGSGVTAPAPVLHPWAWV